jgi:methionyl aminopeptidase
MSTFQIFTPAQIESLQRGGKILRDCLDHVSSRVQPGVTTAQLDKTAETFIRDMGAEPGFMGYQNYPSTLCTSVNEQCVHGLPGDRELKEGDIISIDCGVLLDDLYTDACTTVSVGDISSQAQELLTVTQQALSNALEQALEGAHIGDISSVIQKTVEAKGCVPLKCLTGHGLGDTLHQYPDVPNFGRAGSGPTLPKDTIIAIEPIISVGKSTDVRTHEDGWTIMTADDALSAHFEHTILITENRCDILA